MTSEPMLTIAVVGIMEEMDLSLRLMRRVLPQFFVTNSFAGNGELTLSDLITMLQVQRSYAMTQRGAWAQGYTAKVVVYIRNIIINGNG